MNTKTCDEKRIDAAARYAARRVGLRARKSRQRAHVPNLDNFGGYMLVDAEHGYVVAGSRFELTADDVIAYCFIDEETPRPTA